jgi:hypothetical protein
VLNNITPNINFEIIYNSKKRIEKSPIKFSYNFGSEKRTHPVHGRLLKKNLPTTKQVKQHTNQF